MRVRDLQTRVQVCLEKGVVPAPDTRNTLHKALAAHVQKEVQQHVHSLIISTSLFQPSELPPPSPVHTQALVRVVQSSLGRGARLPPRGLIHSVVTI